MTAYILKDQLLSLEPEKIKLSVYKVLEHCAPTYCWSIINRLRGIYLISTQISCTSVLTESKITSICILLCRTQQNIGVEIPQTFFFLFGLALSALHFSFTDHVN